MSWGRRSRSRGDGYGGFQAYVPVAERRAKAAKLAQNMTSKGTTLQPVQLQSKKIADTFWGKAWCKNLESYSDYANRLPRGRSYVRNGSVLHLEIRKGEIEALVSGSSLYKIKIGIKPVNQEKWKKICKECAGGIGSLMELLSGKLSDRVMSVMTKRESGLFPEPAEITLGCSCPDWADMCKHVAAVMYGVGAQLDQHPELLFLLRHVDHRELVDQASAVTMLTDGVVATDTATLDAADVGDIFGITMAEEAPSRPVKVPQSRAKKEPVKKKLNIKSAVKKAIVKKEHVQTPVAKKAAVKKTILKKKTDKNAAITKKVIRRASVKRKKDD